MTQDFSPGNKPAGQGLEKGYMTLPFILVNKLIILPVQINGSDTLQFIFDTGLENSIICELETDEVLELKQAREVQVRGIGSGKTIEAIQSRGNNAKVGDINILNQDYIIISNNVLQLSRRMGTKIHGMLSMESFSAYVIEIDYIRQHLTFYIPEFFRESANLDGYTSLPLDMQHGAPSINATILPGYGRTYPVKLIIDTGAGNALSLDTGSLPGYSIPEGSRDCYLGCNINGNVKGKIGRMEGMEIGPYHLQDILVSYPDPQSVPYKVAVQGINGSLGSEFLRRFKIILDLPAKKIHIMANNAIEDDFQYDMSGLEILAPAADEPRYIIAGVRSQSNAALAGIRPGDEILTINGIPSSRLNLDAIYRNLLGTDGKKIWLELLRDGTKLRANFRLEKYI
jgi:hypothetical protein